MTEEEMKTEGCELFGLPPRKRFKVMEQQRRRDKEQGSPPIHPLCNDVTNAMALRQGSPKNVTSQGFLVLEKHQQREFSENPNPVIPLLPPRPVAVKRKETPVLPLSALPTMTLKFQGERVHSLSPSAFKSWGSSSKLGFISEASAERLGSMNSPSEARKDSRHRIIRHLRDGFSVASLVGHAKAWTVANRATCSINKAQEVVEMTVCEVPGLRSGTYGSEMYALVPTSTTWSAAMVAMDLVSEGNNGSQIASADHMVGAAQITELDRMTSKYPSAPMEDVMHEVQAVGEEGSESKVPTGIINADLGCVVLLDDTDFADDSHSSPANMPMVFEAANVDIPQASDSKELAGNSQRMCLKSSLLPVVGSTLGNPVGRTELSGTVYSEEGDQSTTLVGVCDSEEATDRVHATNATLGMPEACFCQLTDPLTPGSPIVGLVVSHTSDENSNISKISEELKVTAYYTNKDKSLLNPSDKADGRICFAGMHDEPAVQLVTDALVHLCEVEAENRGVVATTLSDFLAVAGGPDSQETDTKQDRLLAKIDERADILFKQMFEREGYEGCKAEQDSISDYMSQFFFALSGVNDIDSPVVGMNVRGRPILKSQDLEKLSTPTHDDRILHATPSEDYQVDLGRPAFNEVVEGQYMPSEVMTSETPESSSSASPVHEDSAGLDNPEIYSPIPPGSKYGSSRLEEQLQESDCKSSKEDSDWDLDMKIPNFSFDKRIGMTQRVKAPGLWLHTSGVCSTNLDGEAGADDIDGACDICRNPDAEPSDPIVYCDGCDVPVHADCYGNPLSHGVPEGDWFCAQCQSRSPNPRTCCLCPKSGGAMKMTTEGNWAHLSCAVFVPEVFFRKADDLEGIDTSHVPSRRWLSTCCVCKATGGACVDCSEIGCKSSFHVSCGLKKDLALEFRNGRSGAVVISFCQEHTAAWDEQQKARKAGRSKYKIVSREPQKTKASQWPKLR